MSQEKRRAWVAGNPEWVAANKLKVQARQKAGRYRHLDRAKRFRLYGITAEHFEEMKAEQGGKCAICSKPPGIKGLQIDHCHRVGKVRGLLCSTCNMKLSAIETEFFIRAMNYISKHYL